MKRLDKFERLNYQRKRVIRSLKKIRVSSDIDHIVCVIGELGFESFGNYVQWTEEDEDIWIANSKPKPKTHRKSLFNKPSKYNKDGVKEKPTKVEKVFLHIF